MTRFSRYAPTPEMFSLAYPEDDLAHPTFKYTVPSSVRKLNSGLQFLKTFGMDVRDPPRPCRLPSPLSAAHDLHLLFT